LDDECCRWRRRKWRRREKTNELNELTFLLPSILLLVLIERCRSLSLANVSTSSSNEAGPRRVAREGPKRRKKEETLSSSSPILPSSSPPLPQVHLVLRLDIPGGLRYRSIYQHPYHRSTSTFRLSLGVLLGSGASLALPPSSLFFPCPKELVSLTLDLLV